MPRTSSRYERSDAAAISRSRSASCFATPYRLAVVSDNAYRVRRAAEQHQQPGHAHNQDRQAVDMSHVTAPFLTVS